MYIRSTYAVQRTKYCVPSIVCTEYGVRSTGYVSTEYLIHISVSFLFPLPPPPPPPCPPTQNPPNLANLQLLYLPLDTSFLYSLDKLHFFSLHLYPVSFILYPFTLQNIRLITCRCSPPTPSRPPCPVSPCRSLLWSYFCIGLQPPKPHKLPTAFPVQRIWTTRVSHAPSDISPEHQLSIGKPPYSTKILIRSIVPFSISILPVDFIHLPT